MRSCALISSHASFDRTYEDLKQITTERLVPHPFGFDRTYEDLKHEAKTEAEKLAKSFDRTYEDLKPSLPSPDYRAMMEKF